MIQIYINNLSWVPQNFFQIYFDYLIICFLFFSLAYLINFSGIQDKYQQNSTDNSKPDAQSSQNEGASSQNDAGGSSKKPSGGSSSQSGPNNEQQGNTNQNDNSTENKESFLNPPAEEPTLGEKAGLTAYEEGLLTMFLNKSFKRKKENQKK